MSSSDDSGCFKMGPRVGTSSTCCTSFCTSFPFSAISSGVGICCVSGISGKVTMCGRISGNVIPPSTPIFVGYISSLPSRGELGVTSGSTSSLDSGGLSNMCFYGGAGSGREGLATCGTRAVHILNAASSNGLTCIGTGVRCLPTGGSCLAIPTNDPSIVAIISRRRCGRILRRRRGACAMAFGVNSRIVSSRALSMNSTVIIPRTPTGKNCAFDN